MACRDIILALLVHFGGHFMKEFVYRYLRDTTLENFIWNSAGRAAAPRINTEINVGIARYASLYAQAFYLELRKSGTAAGGQPFLSS